MIRKSSIAWAPFSDKHINYINDAIESTFCVAEGAIRAGKTIDNCIIAQMYLETCKDKLHLASGSSMPNAKLNIGDCNGYGLEHLFRGRCRWGKYKDNDALYIQTKTGEKIVIFAGGGKANSFQKILGNSFGLWIATEIDQHYDCDDSRESFIKVAMGRQAAAKQPMILWDLNPCNPKHQIYKNYIDKYQKEKLTGYLYQKFTIMDNLSISDERKKEIIAKYDKESIWYRRDIEGERCVAEGLVYQQFADHEERFIVDVDKEYAKEFSFIAVGIDFGGNKSKTTFIANAFHGAFNKMTTVAEHKIRGGKGEIDADLLCEELIGFIQRLMHLFPHVLVRYCFADNADQYLINSIYKALRRQDLGIAVGDCLKTPIKDRIVVAQTLFNTGRLFIAKDCVMLREGLRGAMWNDKAIDERLDDFTSDIDIIDSWEYTWTKFTKKLCPK